MISKHHGHTGGTRNRLVFGAYYNYTDTCSVHVYGLVLLLLLVQGELATC